jgi:hypothetical protein
VVILGLRTVSKRISSSLRLRSLCDNSELKWATEQAKLRVERGRAGRAAAATGAWIGARSLLRPAPDREGQPGGMAGRASQRYRRSFPPLRADDSLEIPIAHSRGGRKRAASAPVASQVCSTRYLSSGRGKRGITCLVVEILTRTTGLMNTIKDTILISICTV